MSSISSSFLNSTSSFLQGGWLTCQKKTYPSNLPYPNKPHFNWICSFRRLSANRVRSALPYTQPGIAQVKRSFTGCQTQQKPSGCLVCFKSPKRHEFGTRSTLYCNLQKYKKPFLAGNGSNSKACANVLTAASRAPRHPQPFSPQTPHVRDIAHSFGRRVKLGAPKAVPPGSRHKTQSVTEAGGTETAAHLALDARNKQLGSVRSRPTPPSY